MKTCSCKSNCGEKISTNEKLKLRNLYFENSDYESKNGYLFSYLERVEAKMKVDKWHREYKYLLNEKKERINVCLEMMNNLGLSKKRMCTIQEKNIQMIHLREQKASEMWENAR